MTEPQLAYYPVPNAVVGLPKDDSPDLARPMAQRARCHAPHKVFHEEQEDPDWSPAATQALEDRLGDDFGGKLKFPEIECRTDMCEIQVATLTTNQGDDIQALQSSIYAMPKSDWRAAGLGLPTFAVNGLPDGRDAVIVFVSRAP